MYSIDILSAEEKADLLYCLNIFKQNIITKIQFFSEIIKGKSSLNFEILNNCLIDCNKELDKVDLLILKVQNLL
ncbi:MAG: hypothetical protein HFJ29_01415 [Clostridia bacterium]|nr:hypothetical protein [Clostridia bacterium]